MEASLSGLCNLEGLLAQFVFVSDELSFSDQQPEFGHAALDPAFLYGVFERLLALGLDASAASDGVVRARLAKARQDFASEFADNDRFRVKIEHAILLEGAYDGGGSPLLYGRPVGDVLAPATPAESRGADVAFFIAARPWPIPLLGDVLTTARAMRDPDDRRLFFDG